MKDQIIRNIKTFFVQQEEDYYKLARVGDFWSSDYIEYESRDVWEM